MESTASILAKEGTTTDIVKVAFVFQVPSFWPSWQILYDRLKQDNRFSICVFWIHGAQGDWSQMKQSEEFLKENKIPYIRFSDKAVKRFQPDYMIYQTPYDKGHRPDYTWTIRYKRKGIKIVYIPYGIEISDTEDSHIKHFDRSVVLNSFAVYTLSEEMKGEYDKYCLNKDAVRGYGLPRIESLKEKFDIPDEVKKRSGGKKILLWKTHFPKAIRKGDEYIQVTPDIKEYFKFAEWVIKQEYYFVIFMPHPKFFDINERELGAELLGTTTKMVNLLKQSPNVYIDTNNDYRNSLTNSDAIIVDRSAIMVEAGITGVPILYMYNKAFDEPMTPPIRKLLDSYDNGTTADDMILFVERQRLGQDSGRVNREKVFSQVVVNDDGITNRIIEDLYTHAKDLWPQFIKKRFNNESRIVLFGVGVGANFVLKQIQSVSEIRRPRLECFVDNKSDVWGEYNCGIEIKSPQVLTSLSFDYIVITAENYHREIYKQLTEELGISSEKVLNYDEFVVMMKYE